MACRRVAPMPAPIMSLTLLSWEGGLTFGDHEFTSITQLQPTNLQDRACRIELADLGLKFILLPALCSLYMNMYIGINAYLISHSFVYMYSFHQWFLVFGLQCRHTASNPITSGTHTKFILLPALCSLYMNMYIGINAYLISHSFVYMYSFYQWFLVFGLQCRHTASNPITSGTHTSGVQ